MLGLKRGMFLQLLINVSSLFAVDILSQFEQFFGCLHSGGSISIGRCDVVPAKGCYAYPFIITIRAPLMFMQTCSYCIPLHSTVADGWGLSRLLLTV